MDSIILLYFLNVVKIIRDFTDRRYHIFSFEKSNLGYTNYLIIPYDKKRFMDFLSKYSVHSTGNNVLDEPYNICTEQFVSNFGIFFLVNVTILKKEAANDSVLLLHSTRSI